MNDVTENARNQQLLMKNLVVATGAVRENDRNKARQKSATEMEQRRAIMWSRFIVLLIVCFSFVLSLIVRQPAASQMRVGVVGAVLIVSGGMTVFLGLAWIFIYNKLEKGLDTAGWEELGMGTENPGGAHQEKLDSHVWSSANRALSQLMGAISEPPVHNGHWFLKPYAMSDDEVIAERKLDPISGDKLVLRVWLDSSLGRYRWGFSAPTLIGGVEDESLETISGLLAMQRHAEIDGQHLVSERKPLFGSQDDEESSTVEPSPAPDFN